MSPDLQPTRSPMSLHDRLAEDLQQAMKAKDQLRMDVIRMVKAALTNKELELKKHLGDAEMARVMTARIKHREEAAAQYEKARREDVAGKELEEVAMIQGDLPRA